MFDKDSDNERDYREDDDALLAWGEDEHGDEPSHFVA
jgi:hypothetical protein